MFTVPRELVDRLKGLDYYLMIDTGKNKLVNEVKVLIYT